LYDMASCVKGSGHQIGNFHCYFPMDGRGRGRNLEKSLHDLLEGAMMRAQGSGTGEGSTWQS